MLAMLAVTTTHGLLRHTKDLQNKRVKGYLLGTRTSSMVQTSALGTLINKQTRQKISVKEHNNLCCPHGSHSSSQEQHC